MRYTRSAAGIARAWSCSVETLHLVSVDKLLPAEMYVYISCSAALGVPYMYEKQEDPINAIITTIIIPPTILDRITKMVLVLEPGDAGDGV